MPKFSLRRFLVCITLISVAVGIEQVQYQLLRAERSNPWLLAAIGMLSSGLFFCGLMSLDRHSWKWWVVCAIVGTIFAYFVLRRLEFALVQNQFRPLH